MTATSIRCPLCRRALTLPHFCIRQIPPSAHHDAGQSDAEPLAEPTPASPLVSGEPSCVSGRAADAGISSEGNP